MQALIDPNNSKSSVTIGDGNTFHGDTAIGRGAKIVKTTNGKRNGYLQIIVGLLSITASALEIVNYLSSSPLLVLIGIAVLIIGFILILRGLKQWL
jgi:predicted phage tail protein